MNKLPDWMLEEEWYTPQSGNDGYVTKSILRLCRMLERFRNSSQSDRLNISAPFKLAGTLYLILLSSCSKNIFFVYILLALCMIYMCFVPGKALVRMFLSSAGAAALSAVLLLPAALLGHPQTMLTVSVKVFVSVALLGILAETTPWNRLTAALAAFHIPGIFIFTLDITLKYIVILGDISTALLDALKLRSVGKNKKKSKSMSGILGVTFIKSREMADDMYMAMVCRGFDGEYHSRKAKMKPGDIFFALVLVLLTVVFAFLMVK